MLLRKNHCLYRLSWLVILPQESINAINVLTESGADIIELGIPFSDPVADGPINQRAAEIALGHGVTLDSALDMVSQVRARGNTTPIIIFSYLNPILAMGYEKFTVKAKESGVNAVLVVDLPPEEGQEFYLHLKKSGIGIVLLASPTTDPARYYLYQQINPVFLYYISRLSVTGIQTALAANLETEIQNLRKALPTIKIAVGFGISTSEQATQIAKFADGVVIGSLLVKTLEEYGIEAFSKLATMLADSIKLGSRL